MGCQSAEVHENFDVAPGPGTIARTTKHPQRATVSSEEEGMVPQLSRRGGTDLGHVHSHHDVSCSRPQVTKNKNKKQPQKQTLDT